MGFLETNQAAVIEGFVAWHAKLGHRPQSRSIAGGLAEGIQALVPLTTIDRRRWVFFEVGAWTAFFDNGARGTDAGPAASYLAQAIGCRGLRVVAAPDAGGSYGATILEIYGPKQTEFLNYIRTISATNDGGKWRFDLNGAAQPFEDESAYTRRRIKERFTPAMLADYLHALGVSAFDPARYRNPVLVERTDAESPNVEQLSFDEARSRFR